MKKQMILTLILCFQALMVSAQLKVLSNGRIQADGNMGIGLTPSSSYRLYTNNGDIRFNADYNDLIFDQDGGYYGFAVHPSSNNSINLGKADYAFAHIYVYTVHDLYSDIRQKENIRDLENTLDIIMNLRGIRFDLIKSVAYDENLEHNPEVIAKLENERKNKIGFIGQEMVNVLPEAVFIDDSSGIYSIDYTRVIPVLVEAMQEQQEMVERLNTEIELLKSIEQNKNIVGITNENDGGAILGKNRPNPFNENTTIEYYLPSTVEKANLYIYDIQGKQLHNYSVTDRGNGFVTIFGNELNAGMYYYSLIADGVIIGTEKMVLTD